MLYLSALMQLLPKGMGGAPGVPDRDANEGGPGVWDGKEESEEFENKGRGDDLESGDTLGRDGRLFVQALLLGTEPGTRQKAADPVVKSRSLPAPPRRDTRR